MAWRVRPTSDAEALQRTAIAVDGYRLATYSRNARRKWLYASTD